MNGIHLKRVNPPLTPNLEDYKQKKKSKSRRKAVAIQPTNPPTPKITKPHLHLKPTNDKHLQAKQQPTICPHHPDKAAMRYADPNTKGRICTKCYFLALDEDRCLEEIQCEKSRELDQFRGKIKGFGLRLQEAEQCIRDWIFHSQQNFFYQKGYIHDSFEELRGQLDEKQRQLMSSLMSTQQQIKRWMGRGSSEVEEMRKAINRYMEDIENNYEDIIESLSYEQFSEIIDKYNSKIKYFEEELEGICHESSLVVYVPKKEIEKYIAKANVQVYPELPEEQTQQTRTLQRYTTEKTNLYVEGTSKGYLSHHQDSINKISQHRQSRDRDYFFGRGHSTKENHNYDNHIYH